MSSLTLQPMGSFEPFAQPAALGRHCQPTGSTDNPYPIRIERRLHRRYCVHFSAGTQLSIGDIVSITRSTSTASRLYQLARIISVSRSYTLVRLARKVNPYGGYQLYHTEGDTSLSIVKSLSLCLTSSFVPKVARDLTSKLQTATIVLLGIQLWKKSLERWMCTFQMLYFKLLVISGRCFGGSQLSHL